MHSKIPRIKEALSQTLKVSQFLETLDGCKGVAW
jgi:hypothetical protein